VRNELELQKQLMCVCVAAVYRAICDWGGGNDVGHGGTMGKVVNACKVLVGRMKESDRLDDLDVDGTIILYYNIVMDPEGTDSVGVKKVHLGRVRSKWRHPVDRLGTNGNILLTR